MRDPTLALRLVAALVGAGLLTRSFVAWRTRRRDAARPQDPWADRGWALLGWGLGLTAFGLVSTYFASPSTIGLTLFNVLFGLLALGVVLLAVATALLGWRASTGGSR